MTESLRHVAAVALLAGNAVFLFLGVSTLLFVISDWVRMFGARSEAVFDIFAGPVAIALPLLAMLLATHVSPPLPQARLILLAALAEYGVSAFFGVITYLGAFAEGVFSVRSTFNGLLGRAVWLAFLTIAITAVYRVYRAMYPPAPAAAYRYGPTVYGQPYPGQPTYPAPTGYPPPPPPPPPPATAPPGPAPDATVRLVDPASETTRIVDPASETTRIAPPAPAPSAQPPAPPAPTPPAPAPAPPAEAETATLPTLPPPQNPPSQQ